MTGPLTEDNKSCLEDYECNCCSLQPISNIFIDIAVAKDGRSVRGSHQTDNGSARFLLELGDRLAILLLIYALEPLTTIMGTLATLDDDGRRDRA